MKKILSTLGIALFVLGIGLAEAGSVNYKYDSPLIVTQKITDLGGGDWQYDFNFTNTDTSNIWHLFFWSENEISSLTSPFPNTYVNSPLDSVLPEYDVRNLDPNQSYINFTYSDPWGGSTGGIQVGDSGSFSITAGFLTDGFLYGYETALDGYARANGGTITAMGSTVPEPLSMLLYGAGLLGLASLKKRKKEVV